MSTDIVALTDEKAQADFVGWENVPKDLKTRSQWESKYRKVRKAEKPTASVVIMRKMRIESADHEYDIPSQPFKLYHIDQTAEIKRTPLNMARHQFWEMFGQTNDRSKLIRWTKGDWTEDEFGAKVWDSNLDVWGWKTFSKEWFTRPKCIDHEMGRELYGVFGAEKSFYLMIDLDLHKGSLSLFLKRFSVLLDRFWGKHGCHFQVSDEEAGGVHIFLYFRRASPLKTRVKWLLRQLTELDQDHPECQFFRTQKNGRPICQLEIYPTPKKGHRLPLARGRTMLLDQPIELIHRRGKATQDIVGYMRWLNDSNRKFMAKDDVFRFVVDRLEIPDLCPKDAENDGTCNNATSNKNTSKNATCKNQTSKNCCAEFQSESPNGRIENHNYSLRGKTRGALIGYWDRGEPWHFRNINSAIYITLQALRAEDCDRKAAEGIVLDYVRALPNKSLSSRLEDGFPEIERLVHRDAAKIWNSGINGKWRATSDRWSEIGFRVSDKCTWIVSGSTPVVVVDCEEIEFTDSEQQLIVNELAPLIVGRKQALKREKQQEVVRAIAYFLRFVRCCDREIPVHALPKILSGFELKLGKHEKQRLFVNKLRDWKWIYLRSDYYHPAKHGGKASKGRARAYGIGEAMIGKFTLPRTKRKEQEWSYILSSPFWETTENEMKIPSFEEQLEGIQNSFDGAKPANNHDQADSQQITNNQPAKQQ